MKIPVREISCWLAFCVIMAPSQTRKKPSPDDGLVLPPILVDKKKDKEDTQSPPRQVEMPAAVTGETARIAFEIAPVTPRGLLSQQTREALRALLRGNHGATVIKLRAFVAGSGDLRRIGEIVGEVFTERHQPMPALTVIQVGALPREGEQVLIESTEVERAAVNPNGLVFISGQAADTIVQALDKIRAAVRAVAIAPADVLRLSCFVSSLEQEGGRLPGIQTEFPQAAALVVQMQRAPVRPGAECEAVARAHASVNQPVTYLNPTELGPARNYSQLALVGASKLVFTGAQLGFGAQEADIKLVFERLGRVLSGFQTGFSRLAMSSVYVTSLSLASKIRDVRAGFYSASAPPASTLLPFEGLPSMDSSFAVDLVALAP